MKKYKKLFVVLIAVLLIGILLFVVKGCYFAIPQNSLKSSVSESNNLVITPSNVDNSQNNLTANGSCSVVNVNGKLYIGKINENNDYQIYEVQTGTTRLIYEEPKETWSINSMYLNNVLDGKLLQSASSELYLNPETGQFEGLRINHSPGFDYNGFVIENTRYFCNSQKLYKYQSGLNQLLLTADDLNMNYLPMNYGSFYIKDDYFYFGKTIYGDKKDESYICRYDLSTKELKSISLSDIGIKNEDVKNLLFNDEELYFVAEKTLYSYNFSTAKVKKIFEAGDSHLVVNYYNNKLYIGAGYSDTVDNKNGLYMIDLISDKTSKLYNGNVSEVHIIDDEYVYIFDSVYNSLIAYRIKLDDNSVEKILG